jgi:hypothetical protein
VLAGLAMGLPLSPPPPDEDEEVEEGELPDDYAVENWPPGNALTLGVMLAGMSVTSPHTIHPDANWETLTEFAQTHTC